MDVGHAFYLISRIWIPAEVRFLDRHLGGEDVTFVEFNRFDPRGDFVGIRGLNMNIIQELRDRLQSRGEEDIPRPQSQMVIRTASRPRHPAEHIVYPSDASPMQISIAYLRMREMFDSPFFDICSVRDVMGVLGVDINYRTSNTFTLLKGLHCIHWKSIPIEIAESIPAMLSEIYTEGGSTMEAEVIDG